MQKDQEDDNNNVDNNNNNNPNNNDNSPTSTSTPTPTLPIKTHKQIAQLFFKDYNVQRFLIQQLQQVYTKVHSITVKYQKVYIKIKLKSKHPNVYCEDHLHSQFMIKINKSFPIDGVSLHMLDGCLQPKIYDTRDLLYESMGSKWSYTMKIKDVVQNLTKFQEKLFKRNEQYLALQKTGRFMMGQVFMFNELDEHCSLNLFIDKGHVSGNSNPNPNSKCVTSLIGVSQTHFFTFKKIIPKCKTKQQEQQEIRSKTFSGRKLVLSRCCDIQCIQSLHSNSVTKQIQLIIKRYKSVKSFNQYELLNRKFNFSDEATSQQFIKCILKNITKYQPMKIEFTPSLFQKQKIQSKEDSAIQKVLQMNELENRLESQSDSSKRHELLNRLNKSYQKLIEFYSARANPYYLIYVHKLNYLYQRYYVDSKT